MDSVRLRYLIG